MKAKKKRKRRFESAGWLFFIVSAILLAGPVIYLLFRYKSPLAEPSAVFGAGVFLTMMIAGILTWVVNAILQWRAARHRAAHEKSRHA